MWTTALVLMVASASAHEDLEPEQHALLNEAYGKTVPAQALCHRHPYLPEGGFPDVLVMGATQRRAGCKLFGVVVEGAWYSPEEAAKAAIASSETWNDLGNEQKDAALGAWTTEVLLAFDQVVRDQVQVKRRGSAVTVTAPFRERLDAKRAYQDGASTTSFAADGATSLNRTVQGSWDTMFYANPYDVPEAVVPPILGALQTRGKTLESCFDGAWNGNHSLEGTHRISWRVKEGKVAQLALLDVDEKHSPILAQCYANVLVGIEFPPNAEGQFVTWAFTGDRRAR
jgi:hypothetical protein